MPFVDPTARLSLVRDAEAAPTGPSDEALMRLVRSGERRAFEALATRHLRPVASFCARMLGDRASGEELAQEVFLTLWTRRDDYREAQRFAPYLFTLAVNRCRNHQRWWRRLLAHAARWELVAPATSASTALDTLVDAERTLALHRAVSRLPPRLREAVLLRFEQGLDYRALGEAVGCTEVNARTRVFRGLALLRESTEDLAP
jgi:RNA polymerase sigma-70 factor (ECF subfamily)